MTTRICAATLSLVATALAACSGGGDGPLGEGAEALGGQAIVGKVLFDDALPDTNGRSCATCHVEDEHTTLVPASVTARLHQDPHDPLFNAIDADDPAAASLQFAHLQAGLVRVNVAMADNLDLVDENGVVVTGPERTVALWRAVPTVENTAYTAPYQLDGRVATLHEQATQALLNHSQMSVAPPALAVSAIAASERTVFSGPAAAAVAEALAEGEDPPDGQPPLHPGSDAAAGKVLYDQACRPCHGGATGIHLLDEAAHDMLFPELNADGSVTLTQPDPDGTQYPAHVLHNHHGDRYLNLGIAGGTYLGQVGAFPNFTGVDFPRYRVRFYTDGSRTKKLFDLPPLPPAIGPNLTAQAFSVDPGRALISGDPADFEAFDTPQLRGIKDTAPYFHDNSGPDLPTVLDIYSRFILPQLPSLHLPRALPPEGPGLPPESLSPTQKSQLLAYLNLI